MNDDFADRVVAVFLAIIIVLMAVAPVAGLIWLAAYVLKLV